MNSRSRVLLNDELEALQRGAEIPRFPGDVQKAASEITVTRRWCPADPAARLNQTDRMDLMGRQRSRRACAPECVDRNGGIGA